MGLMNQILSFRKKGGLDKSSPYIRGKGGFDASNPYIKKRGIVPHLTQISNRF